MTPSISNVASIGMPEIGQRPSTGSSGADFGMVLSSTIEGLESMNNDAGTAVQKFLTGENEELHTTVLATQRADIAFELGLQVRNKVVSAYQEVMRMQL